MRGGYSPRLTRGGRIIFSGPGQRNCRDIHIPTVLLPPAMFTGLLIGLWIWKCFMMVVFQNKIIYMPGMPPNARRERIADWATRCGGIQWTEERTKAADGTDLGIAVATIPLPAGSRPIVTNDTARTASAHVYVLYFQGNASSIPSRLPDLSWVLRAVSDSKAPVLAPMQLTFVCLSYRGYWTSRGRASEAGIRLDAEAGVSWIAHQHERRFGKDSTTRPVLIIWGQSIGCGVATNLAATGRIPPTMPIKGLILETPFVSVRSMLETLYPQKWLPYKHLWPFLRNHLDSWTNFGLMAQASKESGISPPSVYIIQAERDELVPKEQTDKLYQRCVDVGLKVERGVAPSAYHQEAIARPHGKKLAAAAILKLAKQGLDSG
ncbi:Alpha/Beta hydrolase protein [Podospora fimiseda]|uniref:Alpha/Beta hydrolase protein n=1 Tax=Podospora fimiseda TaxID=252190 RepID=A0AAN7BT01_9PEZI|nr:Alpha/Beta hydrolase protein [Podospora fimiseda]